MTDIAQAASDKETNKMQDQKKNSKLHTLWIPELQFLIHIQAM